MSLEFYNDVRNIQNGLWSSRNPARIDVQTDLSGPSMTRQEFADECDINKLMERYERSGVWPLPPAGQSPTYYDFVGMPDLQSAMHDLIDAEKAFASLPAKVRKEFDNDPLRFVEYASNGDNLEQMRTWGLAEPEAIAQAPMRVEVVNPSPPIVPAPGAPAPAS